MTKPEITKKTSTPTNPPLRPGTPAWKRTTSSTAMARRPSTSGRNLRSAGGLPDSSSKSTGRPSMPEAPEGRVSRTSARYLLMAPRFEAVENCTIDRQQPVDQQGGGQVGRPPSPRSSRPASIGTPSARRSDPGWSPQCRGSPDPAASRLLPPRGDHCPTVRFDAALSTVLVRGCAPTAGPNRSSPGLPLVATAMSARGGDRPGRSSDRLQACGGRLPGAEGLRSTAELPSDIRIVLPGPERGWGFPLDGRGSNSTVTPPTAVSRADPMTIA